MQAKESGHKDPIYGENSFLPGVIGSRENPVIFND
jgi:hypothetical protein